jgi:HlyD family secretion protein
MSLKYSILLPVLLLGCGGTEDELFSGSIEIDEVRISSRVGGEVLELSVTSGDQIQLGQTLVKIDQTEYQFALIQTEAALAIAEANLETMVEGTRQQQIISASSGVESARAAMNQAGTDLLRTRELAETGAISLQRLQAAETAAVQAEAQYSSAVQSYSLAVEGARSTELQAAAALVESAEAAEQLALQRLEWTGVTSPLTGTVTGTNILAGENVTQGMTLLTVADLDSVKAVFYISQPVLRAIDTGSTVTVTTGSDGEEPAIGVITRIADQAEFTPSRVETRDGRTSLVYRIEAAIPNQEGIFKAGMPVDVRISAIQ